MRLYVISGLLGAAEPTATVCLLDSLAAIAADCPRGREVIVRVGDVKTKEREDRMAGVAG